MYKSSAELLKLAVLLSDLSRLRATCRQTLVAFVPANILLLEYNNEEVSENRYRERFHKHCEQAI